MSVDSIAYGPYLSPTMRNDSAGVRARLLLILFGVSLALLMGEVAVRMHRHNPARQWGMCPLEVMSRVPQTIMGIIRPNSDKYFMGVRYRFNSQGIRGPERTPYPKPGVFRIIVVGDSVTMGHGVAEEDTYPALLEQKLNAAAMADRFEVINLGISNANLASVVERLNTLGVPLHPDLIVYGFTLNDIEETDAYRRSGAGPVGVARLENFRRFRHSPFYLLRAVWPRLMSLQELLWTEPGTYAWELNDNYFDNEEAWRIFDGGLAGLANVGARLGVCVNVLIHTHIYYLNRFHPFVPVYKKVEAAAETHGLSVTESLPYLLGHPADALKVSWLDPHPNAAGDRLLAQALYDGLLRLPDGCWQKPVPIPE